jgi:hypothetical protein
MLSEAKHLIAVDANPGIDAMRSFASLRMTERAARGLFGGRQT